jgi:hypothetical protein
MSGFKLKLKNEKLKESTSQFDTAIEKEKAEDRILDFKKKSDEIIKPAQVNLKYNKKEEKKKKSNKYFYRVSNHHELFKIGRSFYSDYMSGVKSFAITSTGYQTSQQKSILGLASFFDHKEDMKIGIISDNLNVGSFKDIVSISKKVNMDMFDLGQNITIHSFYNHFEFLDMNELLSIANDGSVIDYEEVFDSIIDMYDVVFWDVPELHKIQLESEKYFPVIMKFESISIIVAQSLSKKSDIEDIKRFFLGYGINLKGLLLEERTSEENSTEEVSNDNNKAKKDKKPWWKSLF